MYDIKLLQSDRLVFALGIRLTQVDTDLTLIEFTHKKRIGSYTCDGYYK